MLFNSCAFVIFLPIVFILYWVLPQKVRWVLILIASYYFYMSWNAKYVFLILFTTVISYVAARLLEIVDVKDNNIKSDYNIKIKHWILASTSVICLGVLFFFKYFNFISESVSAVLCRFAIPVSPILLNLLLPVGISFYTFQTLSYVIDVYKGNTKAEHHFGYYATFISFFPQLVAGPIERTDNLLPQIKGEHNFDYNQATYGLKLMAVGYFKKIVIADMLSQFVSRIYDMPQSFSGFSLVIATVLFTLQIYCDFSGYSDIAIGTAKLLGINLMTNFKSPYFSQTVKEFWNRWHISLSTWFRDYVYIPLGGSHVGKVRHSLNLLITFLCSGLWHGANWTFVIWGGIHGLAQVIENAIIPSDKLKRKSDGIIGLIRVFLIFAFVSFTWIFFVSNSLADAVYVITHMFVGISSPIAYLRSGFNDIDMDYVEFAGMLAMLVILALYDFFELKTDIICKIGSLNKVLRWSIYWVMGLILLIFSQKGVQAEFVYFQF